MPILSFGFFVQGAFENSHPDAINKVMENSGVPDYIRRWYFNLQTNRECECSIGNATLNAMLNSGRLEPPIGWNPRMDKLIILLNAEPVDQAHLEIKCRY